MKLLKAAAVVALALLWVDSARADLVIAGVLRSVTAAATGPMGPVGGSDSSMAKGLYSKAVMGDGMGPAGSIHAHASQSSTTPLVMGPSLGGIGAAGGSATPATGAPGWSVVGDSFFDVFFTVTLDGDYLLDATVTWMGPTPPLGGGAFLTLEEDVPADAMLTGTTLASISAGPGPPATSSVTTVLTLLAGTPYQLRAVAHVDGGGPPGTFGATASYAFTLSAVPESGAWLLTAPVALGLALAAWRRRRA